MDLKERIQNSFGGQSAPGRIICAVWEFTLGCNLRCSHCGSSAGVARKDELSTEECYRTCEALAELGCRDVALMGGEPLLRDDFYEVGKCVRDLGMNLNIVSNGMLVEKQVEIIASLEPKVVGISLDGMRESHEKIRGGDTWDKTVRAILLLRERGIQVTAITTVSKTNFKDLPQMKDLLVGKGVNWQIQTATPFGNFRKEYMLSKEEFYAAALFIAKQRIKNRFEDLPVVGAHCFGYYSKILPTSEWYGCTAGKSTLGITSNGGIVGCLSMGNDRFIEGNVRERSLRDIWEDPKSFAYSRHFTKDQLGENCTGCKYGDRCKGGCNSVSYTLTGKFHNNPYCFRAIERQPKS
jgi:radical SAM protein with 4Fe4S-binding SPASM domain